MKATARWCFHHRWVVLAVWIVALLASAGAAKSAGSDFTTKFQLSNTPSATALGLLEKDFPAVSGTSDQIVLEAKSGTLRTQAVQSRAEVMLAKVATLPHVKSITSPYGPAGARQISQSGTVGYATVIFDVQPQDLPVAAVKTVISTAQAADSSQLSVNLGGNDIEQANQQNSSFGTILGVIFALVVLFIAFGALP